MALPKSYLTSTKNLSAIFDAIRNAQAPEKFTTKFLESLEFKSAPDRLVIGVLKSLGFLTDDGKPTARYFSFLDQTQSAVVLAEGIREAYADLFQVNTQAHALTRSDVINKFKTLSQGKPSDAVLDKMGLTFTELVKLADFKTPAKPKSDLETSAEKGGEKSPPADSTKHDSRKPSLGGLVYNIQLVLPESRDPAVYDVLFRSLKEHLL